MIEFTQRFIKLLLIIFLFASNLVEAQETNKGFGGSSYSAFGIGMPLDVTSDNFKAQGLLGVSGIIYEVSALSNPALWSRLYSTEAYTGLQLSNFILTKGSVSETSTNLSSGYLHLLLPIYNGKLGLSAGLYPVTRRSYKTINTTSTTLGTDQIDYINEVQGSGGVNKFEIGFGLKLTDNFSFGYAPSIAFIIQENSESFVFNSTQFASQEQNTKTTGTAFSQRFGITGTFNNIFSSTDRISLGATLNLPFSIDTKKDFTTQKRVEGADQTVDLSSLLAVNSGSIDLPLEVSFGLGYAPSIYVHFATEGVFQKWSEFSNNLDPSDNVFMKDRMKVGFGGQFHPYKRNSNSFFSRFKYSGGVSYDTGHLTMSGNDINTLWLNTGLGILGRNTVTSSPSIDISFQYGFRGTTDNNLIKEKIWTLGFSLNLYERMFVRPKLR